MWAGGAGQVGGCAGVPRALGGCLRLEMAEDDPRQQSLSGYEWSKRVPAAGRSESTMRLFSLRFRPKTCLCLLCKAGACRQAQQTHVSAPHLCDRCRETPGIRSARAAAGSSPVTAPCTACPGHQLALPPAYMRAHTVQWGSCDTRHDLRGPVQSHPSTDRFLSSSADTKPVQLLAGIPGKPHIALQQSSGHQRVASAWQRCPEQCCTPTKLLRCCCYLGGR